MQVNNRPSTPPNTYINPETAKTPASLKTKGQRVRTEERIKRSQDIGNQYKGRIFYADEHQN